MSFYAPPNNPVLQPPVEPEQCTRTIRSTKKVCQDSRPAVGLCNVWLTVTRCG
jgi:hypothetical protein